MPRMSARSGWGRARWVFGALCVMGALVVAPQDSAAGPDPAKLKAASESFEAGAKAYSDKRYEEAAGYFEAADSAAPSAKALRLAIKARTNANQPSRAATLAALALERYPDDAETKTLANQTLEPLVGKLHRADISCVSPCLLAVGSRIIHGDAATRWTVYVDPGKTTVGASFLGKITAKDQSISATAGGQSTIRFAPPTDSGATGGGGVGGASAGGGGQGGASTGGASTGGASEGGAATGGSSEGGAGAGGAEPGPGDTADKNWRIHPAFFFVGLAVTAGAGATTIWSGIDTINDPGTDKVRAECAGQGEDCQLYQDAQAKEVRTNALIGATAGAAAITLVLGVVSDWTFGKAKADSTEEPTDPAKVTFEPPRLWVDVGGANSRTGGSEDAVVHLQVEGRF